MPCRGPTGAAATGARTMPGRLWIPDGGTAVATPKQRWRAYEQHWDLDQLDRWCASLGVPVHLVDQALSSRLIEQRYPSTISSLELHPLRFGALLGVGLIALLLITAVAATLIAH